MSTLLIILLIILFALTIFLTFDYLLSKSIVLTFKVFEKTYDGWDCHLSVQNEEIHVYCMQVNYSDFSNLKIGDEVDVMISKGYITNVSYSARYKGKKNVR